MRIQASPSLPRSEKNWTFAGAYHTSNIDSSFLRSVMCMQEVDSTHVNMVMEVYRDGTPPPTEELDTISKAQHRSLTLKAAAAGTASVAGFVGAGMVAANSLISGVLLGGAGLCAGLIAAQCWSERSKPVAAEEAPVRNPWHQEPLWEDTRTLELTASPSRSKVKLDSPQLQSLPLETPKPAELGARLADNLNAFPSKHTAVVLGAHGMGYQCWSDYTTDQVAEMLGATSARIGDKIDLVFFDSCLMGNLEGLRKLAPHARYAVASEQVIYTSDRPWDLALTDLGGARGGPADLGKSIVKAMGAHNEIAAFALIDLEKLEPLARAVEGLGEKLLEQPELAEEALHVNAFGSYHSSRWRVFGDLGQILQRLEANGACPEAVEQCQEALADAVVLNKTRGGYDFAHGLSVQIPSAGFSRRDYEKETRMPQWGKLMQVVSPEPDAEGRHVWKRSKGL